MKRYIDKSKSEILNKAEFKHIFDTYFDSIRSFIYFRCSDEDVASDIAQDVFMRIWEKRDQFDTSSNMKALLYKVANDMVISYYRKCSIRLDFRQHMTIDEHTDSPQEMLQYQELKGKYAQALEQMPDLQRETFLMNREENLKYHEIAERMGISVKAVEKRMTNALQFLKQKLL